MAGRMSLTGSLPGDLARFAARGETLIDYAKARNVDDMMLFLGHVADPERVLASVDLLIKPTRENNPWGRDILEALAAGRPALSVGTYSRFIEDGVTGVLQARFDAAAFAERIAMLADDRAAIGRMGDAARQRMAMLCNGPARASDLLHVWRDAMARRAHV
jgi:glycosyltransferase involved in cell wall biosynthesis